MSIEKNDNTGIIDYFSEGGDGHSFYKKTEDLFTNYRDSQYKKTAATPSDLPPTQEEARAIENSEKFTFFGVDFSQPKNILFAAGGVFLALFIYKEVK